MKNKFCLIAIVAIIGFLAACSSGDDGITKQKPDDGTTTPNTDDGKEPSGSKTPITVAEISITAPVNGGTPATSVNGDEDERFTAGTVTWSPNDNPFKPNTVYTATVKLTAKRDLTFTGLNADQPKVNGTAATILSNTGETVTLSHKFPATSTKIVTSIAIKSSPNNMNYTHGEKLDLTGMVVTLTYNEGAPEDVAPTNFEANGITATPAEGTHLVHTTHNNKPITIKHGSLTPLTTGDLTVAVVNINDLTIEPNSIPAATYTGSDIEPAITVKHHVVDSTRILEKGVDYRVSYSNNRNAGTATITITGEGDYTGSKDINFTINKAAGAPVNTPTLLSNTEGQYATINSVTAPTNGQNVEYGISTSNNAASVSVWQDGRQLSDGVGRVNYIFARSKENDNYLAGTASASLSVVIYFMGSSASNIQQWLGLSSQTPNDKTTPYHIRVLNNTGLGVTLKAITTKYVSLYLLDSIGDSAFSGCTTIVSIIINNNSIGSNAFQGCTSLANVTLGNSVNSIGAQAFNGCTSLANVTLGNSVNSIGNNAFSNCHSLTNITIPDSVTSIGNNAFIICTSLSAINVNAGNSEYLSQDGILYNKAKTTLIKYPAGKTSNTFTIPNNVTSIASAAFAFCNSLNNVTIPNSVTSIGNYAFDICTSLTSVTFATGSNIPNANFGDEVFPEGISGDGGDTLKSAYNAASPKAGTYTREANGDTWGKQ